MFPDPVHDTVGEAGFDEAGTAAFAVWCNIFITINKRYRFTEYKNQISTDLQCTNGAVELIAVQTTLL
jgi:hypothetical protein